MFVGAFVATPPGMVRRLNTRSLFMRLVLLPALLLAGCATMEARGPSIEERAARWTADVATLSSDAMEGREAGSPGYDRAAAYVADRLRGLGLEPAGTDGYLQPIAFVEQKVDYAATSVRLVAGGVETTVAMPGTAIPSPRRPLPPAIDAPLVFVGYGLHLPVERHDDFAGVDLRGKIAVFVSGGPAELPGPAKAHFRAQRLRFLASKGAVGAISITTAKQAESPWSVRVGRAGEAGLSYADPAVGSDATPLVDLNWNPAEAERLFAASGRSYAEFEAAADASRPVTPFDLKARLVGRFAGTRRPVSSSNVVARLPGSDPALAAEHVVLSAHLDGLGIGPAVEGDTIRNGALDNAGGAASLFDIAERLRAARPRRSILFAFVTAEERGLLGARYFARRPTVPKESMVANLNSDMTLPLFPLRSVIAQGAEESSLGEMARAVGAAMGLPLAPDPYPNRSSFIRSDQYGFIEQGIPALSFKFGFAAGTAEAEIERRFRATRYHQPSDDMSTPVFPEDEIRLHDFIAGIALRVANDPARPRWNTGSIFAK
jgi:hypothetical protein